MRISDWSSDVCSSDLLQSGKTVRSIDVAAHAGTAFDGRHLFQIAEDRIQKIDPQTARVPPTIPPLGGGGGSGLDCAEGPLWVGQDLGRKIHQTASEPGAVPPTISTNRLAPDAHRVHGEP